MPDKKSPNKSPNKKEVNVFELMVAAALGMIPAMAQCLEENDSVEQMKIESDLYKSLAATCSARAKMMDGLIASAQARRSQGTPKFVDG
jgi:hypothetical protein